MAFNGGFEIPKIIQLKPSSKNFKNHKMTSMRLVLGEINPKILLILSSLLVLIALYSFKGKAETVYYFYDVEKPTGTIQKPKIRILVNRDEQKNHVYGRSRKFKNFHSRAYRLKSHLENRFSKSASLTITKSYIIS